MGLRRPSCRHGPGLRSRACRRRRRDAIPDAQPSGRSVHYGSVIRGLVRCRADDRSGDIGDSDRRRLRPFRDCQCHPPIDGSDHRDRPHSETQEDHADDHDTRRDRHNVRLQGNDIPDDHAFGSRERRVALHMEHRIARAILMGQRVDSRRRDGCVAGSPPAPLQKHRAHDDGGPRCIEPRCRGQARQGSVPVRGRGDDGDHGRLHRNHRVHGARGTPYRQDIRRLQRQISPALLRCRRRTGPGGSRLRGEDAGGNPGGCDNLNHRRTDLHTAADKRRKEGLVPMERADGASA